MAVVELVSWRPEAGRCFFRTWLGFHTLAPKLHTPSLCCCKLRMILSFLTNWLGPGFSLIVNLLLGSKTELAATTTITGYVHRYARARGPKSLRFPNFECGKPLEHENIAPKIRTTSTRGALRVWLCARAETPSLRALPHSLRPGSTLHAWCRSW